MWGKVGNPGKGFLLNFNKKEGFVSSFKGRYLYSVDEKGRVALPAKLRINLAASVKGNFVITRGFERCLYIYPQDEWNKLEQFVRSLANL